MSASTPREEEVPLSLSPFYSFQPHTLLTSSAVLPGRHFSSPPPLPSLFPFHMAEIHTHLSPSLESDFTPSFSPPFPSFCHAFIRLMERSKSPFLFHIREEEERGRMKREAFPLPLLSSRHFPTSNFEKKVEELLFCFFGKSHTSRTPGP